MRTSLMVVVAIAGFTGISSLGCGGGDGKASVASPGVGATATAAPSTLLYFEGSFNTAAQQLELVYRSPTGEITQIDRNTATLSRVESRAPAPSPANGLSAQAAPTTLDYGTGTDQVYLHTLPGSITYHLGNCYIAEGAADLWGYVAPVNGYSVPVTGFTAHVDSISLTGSQFYTSSTGVGGFSPPPASADYFDVAANSTGTTGYFEFCLPTEDDFTFTGHIEGALGP